MESKPAIKIPTITELVDDSEEGYKSNALMVILNQKPPTKWVKTHPTIKIKNEKEEWVPLPYIPVERLEYMLTRIYGRWWMEVKTVGSIANSVYVVVRVYVTNPITNEVEWNDGCGAVAIQTNAGAGAMDWNAVKSNAIQIGMPAAKSYAFKDAVESFGNLFGKDLTRKDNIDYNSLLKPEASVEDLQELLELKKEALSEADLKDAERIISGKEKASYNKLFKNLSSK